MFPEGEKTTAASRGDGEAAVVVMGRVTLARLLGQGFLRETRVQLQHLRAEEVSVRHQCVVGLQKRCLAGHDDVSHARAAGSHEIAQISAKGVTAVCLPKRLLERPLAKCAMSRPTLPVSRLSSFLAVRRSRGAFRWQSGR